MADFSTTEKINAAFKHLFGVLGTSNLNGAAGKAVYEETIPASHIVFPEDIWSSSVSGASTLTQARSNASTIVQDRSQGESISLVANGSDWDVTTTGIVPMVGFQITNVHPSPSYVKSITAVSDLGGGNYTITLSNNSGVSAGAAVLHSRVYLTVDPSTNGMAWFAREQVGNHFSDRIKDFIPPHVFGQGYSVRLYEKDGTEILASVNPFLFNWQQGSLHFPFGYTAIDSGFSTPLYIEAFRYTGEFGTSSSGGTSLTPGLLHDTLRFDGIEYVPNSSLKADGVNVTVANRLTVSGSIVIPSGTVPTSSLDPGTDGEVRRDGNFIYLHTGGRWVRSSFQLF